VQPFTCTFPNCNEPKSFKRKADWVRHENERHRQLESWTCQIADCNHTCYRKDNFVQHLVREHKIAEPRQRTSRAGNKDAPATSDPGKAAFIRLNAVSANAITDDIWTIVERCHHDTTKQPKDEPCRFCGNICNSWKKLTVHLAKHMEQISMPVLPLVDQKQLNADSIISPVVELSESRKLSNTSNRSPIASPSRYNPSPTFAPGIDPFSLYAQDSKPQMTSATMQTYPQPQMIPFKNPQANGYANFVANNTAHYPSQTYPGPQGPPKSPNGYTNGLQIPNQAYHNGMMHNGVQQYGMTPATSVQQQQSMYTDSPVDTTTAFPSYYRPDPQALTNDMSNISYDDTNGMPYQQGSTYPAMSYMTSQHNYQYQQQ
jgi:hypothetical protein